MLEWDWSISLWKLAMNGKKSVALERTGVGVGVLDAPFRDSQTLPQAPEASIKE